MFVVMFYVFEYNWFVGIGVPMVGNLFLCGCSVGHIYMNVAKAKMTKLSCFPNVLRVSFDNATFFGPKFVCAIGC